MEGRRHDPGHDEAHHPHSQRQQRDCVERGADVGGAPRRRVQESIAQTLWRKSHRLLAQGTDEVLDGLRAAL